MGNQKKVHFKSDGWYNLLTGIGLSSKDKIQNTKVGITYALSRADQTNLYHYTRMGKRVIDIPINDMVREWVSVEGDTDGYLVKEMHRIHTKNVFKDALRWQDVYGGALIVVGLNDGQDLEEELNENNLQSVDFLRVYDRTQVTWSTIDIEENPKSPRFGQPTLYEITPSGTSSAISPSFKVHWTRTLKFEGLTVDDTIRANENGWSLSRYETYYETLRGLGNSYHNVEHLINDFVTFVLSIDNLAELLSSGKESQIRERLNLLDMSRSILNMFMIDKEEKVDTLTASMTGLREAFSILTEGLCAVTGIPDVKLFGKQSKGLGGEDSGSIRIYYDEIAERQDDELLEHITRLCELILISKDNSIKSNIEDGWNIKFNPLWQPTEKEIEDTRLTTAKRDEIYISTGVLDPSEVANSRFGGDHYSSDTNLEVDRDTPNFDKEEDINNEED